MDTLARVSLGIMRRWVVHVMLFYALLNNTILVGPKARTWQRFQFRYENLGRVENGFDFVILCYGGFKVWG